MPPTRTTKQPQDSTARQGTALVSSGFDRVSKKRPCRICKQSTWCGFSRDQRTSICMRVSQGARGISQNGGNIHVHTEIPTTIPILTASPTHSPPSIPIAPLEIRHAVFTELIRLSPAAKYRTELVTGPSGLYARGLTHQHALTLGALPKTHDGRATLARALNSYVSRSFPDYAKLYGAGVIGIPGFWQEPSGQVHVWKLHNYRMPILVIPYKNAHGLIQACQIRLHQDDIAEGEKKYRWLASPSERYGTSSGTPIHFTFSPTFSAGATVVLTEGALKGETFVHHRPKARVIATSGVSCSHDQLIEAARAYNALIAFDADHRINPSVCRQLARLIARRFEDSIEHRLTYTTRILFWEGPKGIDEAAQQNVRMQTKTISEWYETLTNEPREEVGRFWSEISFHP